MAARLLHGASWNVAAQLTPVVINLVLTPYLIHGLGIDQYGLYALAATITIFLSSFDGGIGPTAQRFFSLYAGRDDRRTTTRLLCTLIAVIVVAGGIVSTADWILSPLIATAFHMPRRYRPESVFLLRTFGVLMTISLLHNLFVALLQARQRFGLTSKATIASYMAWAVGIYFTIQGHHGLRGIALALVGEQVLATLVIVPSALRYLQWRAIRFVPRRDLKHFFGYAARAQTMGIAALVNMEFDALIIGAVLPVRNVGLYNAGANVSTQLRYVATSVLPPVSSQLANTFGRDGEPNTLREMARLQRLWVVATSGWCSAGLGAVYFGIVAWLGQSFRVSAMVCLILLAGHAVNLLTGITTCYANAVGKPGVETRYGVFGMLINVALTIPLVLLGVVGVVAATAVGQVVGTIYLRRVVRKRLSPDVPGFFGEVPIIRSILCGVGTALLELAIRPIVPNGPLGLLACCLPAVVGLAGYALSILGLRPSVRMARSLLSQRSLFGLIST